MSEQEKTQEQALSPSEEIVRRARMNGHLSPANPFRQRPERLEPAFDSVIDPTMPEADDPLLGQQPPEYLNGIHTHSLPPALGLLWQCNKCGHYQVSKHMEETVEANWENGSKESPLKGRCKHKDCRRRTRLRSEQHDHVLAEVSWHRIIQRKHLIELAEHLNIHRLADGHNPPRNVAYRLWNQLSKSGTRRGRIPMPFRRWMRRGENR